MAYTARGFIVNKKKQFCEIFLSLTSYVTSPTSTLYTPSPHKEMPLPARPGAGPQSGLKQHQLALLESQRRWVAHMVSKGHTGEGWFRLKERALAIHQQRKHHAVAEATPNAAPTAAPATRAPVDIDADLMELLKEKRLGNWARHLEQVGITSVSALRSIASEAELPQNMPGVPRRVLMAEVMRLQQLMHPVQMTPAPHMHAPHTPAETYSALPQQEYRMQNPNLNVHISPSPRFSPSATPAQPSPPLSHQSSNPMSHHHSVHKPSVSPSNVPPAEFDEILLPKPNEQEESVVPGVAVDSAGLSLYSQVDPSEQGVVQLEICGVNCNKKFAADRIHRHRTLCAKPRQQREQFDSAAMRKTDAQSELDPHAKKGEQPERQKPRSKDPVSCPHCQRKFAPDVAQKHMPGCAERSRRQQMNQPNVHRRSDK